MLKRNATGTIAAATLFVALAGPAAAETQHLGDVFTAAETQLKWITGILGIVFFVLGAWLIVNGITTLKNAVDSQGTQVKYSQGFLKLAGGGFITSMDFILLIGTEALTGGSSWLQPGFTVGNIAAVDDAGFVGMAANFARTAAGPLTTLVAGACVVIGIVLIASAIMAISQQGSPQARLSGAGISGRFLAGIALVNSFWLLNMVSETLGWSGPLSGGWTGINSMLSYTAGNENAAVEYGSTIVGLAFIALIPFGLIAFARGILLIKSATEGNHQASVGSGATHMIGGVALVNAKAAACTAIASFASSGGIPAWC